MTAHALQAPRFVRKTRLAPHEYRRDFYQIDRDVVSVITSEEASEVTQLMSKIYLRLVNAPKRFWEREGVLRFEGEVTEEGGTKAWKLLCAVLDVASATASKALQWLHKQGVIGYYAGKNGAGIRIFINRAAASIGTRPGHGGQKILSFSRASNFERADSTAETPSNDSFAVLESLDTDVVPRAPGGGADATPPFENRPEAEPGLHAFQPVNQHAAEAFEPPRAKTRPKILFEEMVRRVVAEVKPALCDAAASAASREHERTREWLESRGLPKAARVAQREAYNVLRRHVAPGASRRFVERADEDSASPPASTPRRLAAEELTELAETCVAMLEVHGRAVETTLAELCVAAGGTLLPEDASEVRRLAEMMCRGRTEHGAGTTSIAGTSSGVSTTLDARKSSGEGEGD